MATFAPETLRALHDRREVAIRTDRHPASAVTIWIVVADSEVLVRSVRGAKGRWYRDLAGGGPAILEFDGRQVAVAKLPRLPGRMQRVGEEEEAVRGSARRHGLGRDPAAHRSAAVQEALRAEGPPREFAHCAGGGLQHCGGIGGAPAALGVDEVVEQDAPAAGPQRFREAHELRGAPSAPRAVP